MARPATSVRAAAGSVAEPAPLPAFIHASAIIVGEDGILIRGRSGAGKSSLALRLIGMAKDQRRFAALVGDDRVRLSRHGGRLIVEGHPAIQGRIEQRGEGILRCETEPAAVLRAIVDLVDIEAGEAIPRLPDGHESRAEIGGVSLLRLRLSDRAATAEQADRILAFLNRARAGQ